ncbi:MAG: hypothetical protein U1F76_05235 [Candidatus Competibacteraceae bacterium]
MNRRFERYQYRQAVVRMRLGDADREIAKVGLMGRRNAAARRPVALAQGWLNQAQPVPDEATLAAVLTAAGPAVTTPSQSLVEPYRQQVTSWWQAGVQGTAIHQALVRQYGFSGSYLSVARFLQGLKATVPNATVILEFAPGDAAQVDFGRGPELVDTRTGELRLSSSTSPSAPLPAPVFMIPTSSGPMASWPRATAFGLRPAHCASRSRKVGSRLGSNMSRTIFWRWRTAAVWPMPTRSCILAKGLDQLPLAEPVFDTLAASYTGQGRFYRGVGRLLSH